MDPLSVADEADGRSAEADRGAGGRPGGSETADAGGTQKAAQPNLRLTSTRGPYKARDARRIPRLRRWLIWSLAFTLR
jgi:hypothetical protein